MNDEVQKEKSKYLQLFQWPVLPELKMKSNNFHLLRKLWDAHSKEEIEDYISILKEKKAVTSMLNYYRANNKLLKRAANEQILGNIYVPVLFIWGKNDMAVGAEAVNNSHQYMKEEYTFIELEGGHWLIQSNYPEVKPAIIEHLSKCRTEPNKKDH